MKKKRKNMGIGPIGGPNTIFPRQFRWTLNSKHESRIEYFAMEFSSDYVNKTVDFTIMEVFACELDDNGSIRGMVSDFEIDKWVRDVISGEIKEELTLTTYDGCGVELYSLVFHGIKIVKHCSPYDYKSNEVVVHELQAKFEKVDRIYHLTPEVPTCANKESDETRTN